MNDKILKGVSLAQLERDGRLVEYATCPFCGAFIEAVSIPRRDGWESLTAKNPCRHFSDFASAGGARVTVLFNGRENELLDVAPSRVSSASMRHNCNVGSATVVVPTFGRRRVPVALYMGRYYEQELEPDGDFILVPEETLGELWINRRHND